MLCFMGAGLKPERLKGDNFDRHGGGVKRVVSQILFSDKRSISFAFR